MVSYHDFEALLIVVVFGVLGIVLAMILKTLYDRGIVINEFITGGSITISSVMALIIIFSLAIGIIVAGMKK